MAIGWQVRGKPLSAVFLAASRQAAAPTRNPCIKRCETRGSWLPCVKAEFESLHISSIRRRTSIDSLSSWRRRGRQQDVSSIDERLVNASETQAAAAWSSKKTAGFQD